MSSAPIVIGGCARSGTTLLLSILSCHPAVYAIPDETFLLCPGAYGDGDITVEQPMPDRCLPPNVDAVEALVAADPASRGRRWCEKTPRNALCFDAIADGIPGAEFVYIVRDGRAVVTSRHPYKPDGYWVTPAWWVEETTVGLRQAERVGAHVVRYEDVILRYRDAIGGVLAHLGERWHPDLDRYPDSATVSETPNWFQPARPLDPTGIYRWRDDARSRRRVEDLLVEPGGAELLDLLGYT